MPFRKNKKKRITKNEAVNQTNFQKYKDLNSSSSSESGELKLHNWSDVDDMDEEERHIFEDELKKMKNVRNMGFAIMALGITDTNVPEDE